ncbi:MAG: GFA family protein [Deltaproteobacteria bacterium]|nr:GFA family protein [Deltaproteobacteria bacterium]
MASSTWRRCRCYLEYTETADSGNTVSRGFYPECGSPLFSRLSGMTDVVGVRAGSLDDPN